MIIIKVRNGIGNQLFIYAFGEFLRMKFPQQKILYDFSELPYSVNGRNTICFSEFVKNVDILEPKDVRKYLGKILYFHRFSSNDKNFLNKLKVKIINNLRVKKNNIYIKEPLDSEEERLKFTDKIFAMNFENNNYVFDGFWEDIRYAECVKEQLRYNINFSGVDIKNDYKKYINNYSLISVHIRRGDYIKESFSDLYPRYFYAFCDDDYYCKAIEFINDSVKNPMFVFFSDDIDYVKEKYKNITNKIIIEGQRDYEDMYLMTLCDHHIVANSTFSFWGAYLGHNNNGITIAPNLHYARMISHDKIWIKEYFKVDNWKYIEVGDKLNA